MSHLFIFAFIYFALAYQSENVLLQFMSKSVLPTFSSRIFMMSCLKFWSLNHFHFSIVYCLRKSSNFIVSYIAVQRSLYPFLKRLSFIHYKVFPLYRLTIDVWIYFWALYFCSIDLCSDFFFLCVLIPPYFDYHSLGL